MTCILLFCAAMDILANCRAMLPAEPITMEGEIVLRNRKGIPSGEYDYSLRADRTDSMDLSRYELPPLSVSGL